MSGWAQAPGCFELCEFLQLFRALIRDCECSDSEVKIDIANVSLMERFVEVLDKYHELAKVDSVLEFDIDPGMSSGELSYLMLWSRLYHQFGRCKPGAGKECLVFVDEGEYKFNVEHGGPDEGSTFGCSASFDPATGKVSNLDMSFDGKIKGKALKVEFHGAPDFSEVYSEPE